MVEEKGMRLLLLGTLSLGIGCSAISDFDFEAADGGPLPDAALPEDFELSVVREGDGEGSVRSVPDGIACGSTCSARFPVNQVVTLVAASQPGSVFEGWAEAASDCAEAPTCTVDLSADVRVAARFALRQVPLAVSLGGDGSGAVRSEDGAIDCRADNPEGCSAVVPATVPLTLSASAAGDAVFAGWSGDCDGTGTCVLIPLDEEELRVGAAFDEDQRSVNVTLVGQGRVFSAPAGVDCGETCSASFLRDSMVTLTAEAAAGWSFSSWGGACADAPGASCELTMSEARSVAASFVTQDFTLTVHKSGDGRENGVVLAEAVGIDCGEDCSAEIPFGTEVVLTAVGSSRADFVEWQGCDSVEAMTCTVAIDGATAVRAIFSACGSYADVCCSENVCAEGACLNDRCVKFGGMWVSGGHSGDRRGNRLNFDEASCPDGFVTYSMDTDREIDENRGIGMQVNFCYSPRGHVGVHRGHFFEGTADVRGICRPADLRNYENRSRACAPGVASVEVPLMHQIRLSSICSGVTDLCVDSSAERTTYGGAYFQGTPSGICGSRCQSRNPVTGTCSCPAGFTEESVTTRYRISGRTCPGELTICVRQFSGD